MGWAKKWETSVVARACHGGASYCGEQLETRGKGFLLPLSRGNPPFTMQCRLGAVVATRLLRSLV